jgi:hypothetical protein
MVQQGPGPNLGPLTEKQLEWLVRFATGKNVPVHWRNLLTQRGFIEWERLTKCGEEAVLAHMTAGLSDLHAQLDFRYSMLIRWRCSTDDGEGNHIKGDDLLRSALKAVGMTRTVQAYDDIEKFY